MLGTVQIEVQKQQLKIVDKPVLQLSVNTLDDAPCVAEERAFLVSFQNYTGSEISKFNIMPASKAELTQLALFLGTCTYFHGPVTHEIVPGQHVTSVPTIDGKVNVTFSTDSDLVEMLSDLNIARALTLTLSINQLEAYEEFIISSIAADKEIQQEAEGPNLAVIPAKRAS